MLSSLRTLGGNGTDAGRAGGGAGGWGGVLFPLEISFTRPCAPPLLYRPDRVIQCPRIQHSQQFGLTTYYYVLHWQQLHINMAVISVSSASSMAVILVVLD